MSPMLAPRNLQPEAWHQYLLFPSQCAVLLLFMCLSFCIALNLHVCLSPSSSSLRGTIRWMAKSQRDSLEVCCWPTVASNLVNSSWCRRDWRRCLRMHRYINLMLARISKWLVLCGFIRCSMWWWVGLHARMCDRQSVPEEKGDCALWVCERDRWEVIHYWERTSHSDSDLIHLTNSHTPPPSIVSVLTKHWAVSAWQWYLS